MTLFNQFINEVFNVEGGYVNDPQDSGGETNHGITVALARKYGWKGDMRNLPKSLAIQILKEEFWLPLKLDVIEFISPAITHELLDTGVNCGTGRAGIFFQQALNALNNRQKLYKDIAVDGVVGNGTLAALRAYIAAHGQEAEGVMMKALNCLQGAYYISISQQASNGNKNEKFVFGWFKNRVF